MKVLKSFWNMQDSYSIDPYASYYGYYRQEFVKSAECP